MIYFSGKEGASFSLNHIGKQQRRGRLLRHIGRLDQSLAGLDRLDRRYVRLRGSVLLAGSLALILSLIIPAWQAAAPWVGAFFGLLFAALVFLHRRVDRSRLRFRLARLAAAAQVARQDLDWANIPAHLALEVDPEHPYAADLLVVGRRSLHHLLDTAASREGSLRLAEWLLKPLESPAQIEDRQSLLRELLPLTGLRSRLRLLGLLMQEKSGGRWESERLLIWLEQTAAGRSLLPLLILLFALSSTNIVLFALNLLGVLPAYWPLTLAVYAGIYLYRFREYASLMFDAFYVSEALEQFRGVLVYLEKYPFPGGGKLERLCSPFLDADNRPSRYLRKIVWLTSAASLGSNQFLLVIFNALLPWNLLFAHLMDGYKKELRGSLLSWLNTWYELEALSSLANFAYLNPEAVFPQVWSSLPAGQPVFRAESLGHPLIPDHARVSNDFYLSELGEVALITGSNMSGKSTFLRTLGINLVLAFSGAPVLASALQTCKFRLFTCIQVSDSLSNGISYFYAEVRRLKALLEALQVQQAAPVFFLIDEIFRGTNNRERRIGSRSYVRALASSRGAGAISTHDLELAHLSDGDPHIFNYHFKEEIRQGRMIFDYLLRRGPSPTTNALKIMELEGLPVEDIPEEEQGAR